VILTLFSAVARKTFLSLEIIWELEQFKWQCFGHPMDFGTSRDQDQQIGVTVKDTFPFNVELLVIFQFQQTTLDRAR